MKRIPYDGKPRLMTIFVCFVCTIYTVFVMGCDDGGHGKASFESFGNKTTGTGSASFTIQWHDAPALPDSKNTVVVQAIDDCESHGIATITCNVYDDSNTYLTSGGPWPCLERRGRINTIPAGQNRRFVILGADTDGNSVYHGHSTDNITITPGETTDIGTIDAHLFVPVLSTPKDGADVTSGAFSLNWNSVESAHEYRILVSDTDSFEALIIDETTTDTTYSPSDLPRSTTYYWKIYALDAYGNQGAESAVLRFTTANNNLFPPADDDTASTDEDTAVTIDVLANDTDEIGDTLIVSAVTQGENGSVTINTDGVSVTYTPDPNISGSDRFTYTVSDGTTTDDAAVIVTINPTPDPPRAAKDTYSGVKVFSIDNELNVLENDNDPDKDDTLRITAVDSTSVEGGSITINTMGDRLIYTPATGFFGDDFFTYTITDEQGNSATAEVTVAVVAETARVSVDSDGQQASGTSYSASISADGRFVAFKSSSDGLVSGDGNGVSDIFVYDRQTGIIERVSVSTNGEEADGHSYGPVISADGRFVAFDSLAANLVPNDTNKESDIFIRDRQGSGVTERVSIASDGSEADGYSYESSISADGRFVVFMSTATNLVPNDGNNMIDIFVRDRQGSGVTERVSIASDGSEANSYSYEPAISADGRFVAFQSPASNLVDGDGNGFVDIFIRDRQGSGVTERVSIASDGSEADGYSFEPAISADGRFVAFESTASNLVDGDGNGREDIFIRDRLGSGATERISLASDGSEADDNSYDPSISGDGRFVTFASYATNLDGSDTDNRADFFIRDRENGGRTALAGDAGDYYSKGGPYGPVISTDGRFVAFESYSGDLVPDDTNEAWDVFAAPNPLFDQIGPE